MRKSALKRDQKMSSATARHEAILDVIGHEPQHDQASHSLGELALAEAFDHFHYVDFPKLVWHSRELGHLDRM